MTKKPFVNALTASIYIFFVVGVMNFLTQFLKNKPDTFLAPVTILFILTLSVTIMAFLFFYQPLILFVGGKKKQAVKLFTKTVIIFAAITVLVLTSLFLTSYF